MQFSLAETELRRRGVLEAYERLIRDAMNGDRTLFTTAEGIERLWEVSDPLLDDPPPVHARTRRAPGARTRFSDLIAPHRWRLPFERALARGEGRGPGRRLIPTGPRAPGAMLTRVNSAFVRGLTQGRLSRRQLLRGAGGAVAGAYVGSALAACGIAGTRDTGAPADYNWSEFWNQQQVAGSSTGPTGRSTSTPTRAQHPSIDEFTQKTGIQVNYRPVIQDNASFFAQISPVLQAEAGHRLRPDRDHRRLGADADDREPLADPARPLADPELLPLRRPDRARARVRPQEPLHGRPGRRGSPGIAYDPRADRARDHSVQRPLRPGVRGQGGDDVRRHRARQRSGCWPSGSTRRTSTPADWRRAADLLTKQRDDGIVRQYYDQSYIKALEDGDTWISQAWSGDVFQANNSGFPRPQVRRARRRAGCSGTTTA